MSNIGNKETMAKNLSYYVRISGKSQKELSEIAGVAPSTFNDWLKAKKYPRIDKIERLADYFGILKSDLIEEKLSDETKKDNDSMAAIIVKMRMNNEFFETVQKLSELEPDKLAIVNQFLNTFVK